jgi:hypothetical protein
MAETRWSLLRNVKRGIPLYMAWQLHKVHTDLCDTRRPGELIRIKIHYFDNERLFNTISISEA